MEAKKPVQSVRKIQKRGPSTTGKQYRFNQPVNVNLSVLIEKSIEKQEKQQHESQRVKTNVVKKQVVGSNSNKVIRLPAGSKPLSPSIPHTEKPADASSQKANPSSEEQKTKKRKPTVMKRAINSSGMDVAVPCSHIDSLKNGSESIALRDIPSIRLDSLFVPEEDTHTRDAVIQYIKSAVTVSELSFKKDPEKAKQHRFIITGLHEVMHYLKHDKALFVCIAEDIVDMSEEGLINTTLQAVVEYSRANHTPVVQCLKRRKIARLFHRGQCMSCICFLKGSMAVTPEWKALVPILDARFPHYPLC